MDRQRRSFAQALPGSVVDFIGNRIQLLFAVPSQVGALGRVLANKAIHVLVGAPLPGAVWIAELHGNTSGLGQLFVPYHLSALSYVMLWRIGTAPVWGAVRACCGPGRRHATSSRLNTPTG